MADTNKAFHQQVAEKLIEQLKEGTAPWQKPWEPGEPSSFIPINPTTGKRYRGINAIQLMSQGRTDQRWMTYKQAAAAGAQVRRGEQGTPIQYWKFSEEQTKTDESGKPVFDAKGQPVKEEVRLERPRVFFATVFNAEQIDGLPPIQPRKQQKWNAIERAENILKASGAMIQHSEQNSAFYRPATDSIHLPDKAQFSSADNYYATALHELGHWTGHPSRLDRDLAHPFGSEGYAKEELRAEIASMILGDELGIGHDPGQHAAYVGSWIKALQDDPLEIFRAAAEAEKIQDYVLILEQQQFQEQTAEQFVMEKKQNKEQEPAMQVTTPSIIDADAEVVGTRLDMKTGNTFSRERDAQAFNVAAEKTYIDVPYKQKEEAKALGARWDRQHQSWYVLAGVDLAPFVKWVQVAAIVAESTSEQQKTVQGREYLAVPYGERAAAKAAGALWDKGAKSWYVGPSADMSRLQRWFPENVPGQQSPAMTPRDEFAEALRSIGCVVSGEHPIMDGKKHRISVEGEKYSEKAGSGFYVGHLDGHPAGYMKNNKTGIDMKWKSKGYALDPEQKARMQAEAAEKLQARAAEQEWLYEQTAQRVCKQMESLLPVTEPTAYMKAKGIEPQLGVFTDREGQKTYIPATDAQGKQWTMQYIQEDGTKRFAKDSRKEGCFHIVGGEAALAKAPALVIGEGYATAGSLSQTLGFATVAAFDSGNLVHVAKALHKKYPDKPVVIAGDDDKHLELTQGINPGCSKAEEAAKAVGAKVLMPIFAPDEQSYPAKLEPITPEKYRKDELSDEQKAALSKMKQYTDFNDLATKSALGQEGIERQVRAVVDNVIQRHQARIVEELQQERMQRQGQSPRRTVKIG